MERKWSALGRICSSMDRNERKQAGTMRDKGHYHDEGEAPLAFEISELTVPAMAPLSCEGALRVKFTGRMPQIAITAGSF